MGTDGDRAKDKKIKPGKKKQRPLRHGVVTAKETVSPNLVRLTVRCPELANGEIEIPEASDSYVKIAMTDADGDRVLRTYTVRRWLPETAELQLDFVIHGDQGLAGPWAREVEVGAELEFHGPGGTWHPDTSSDRIAHLLVGDLAALPAIEVALERIPDGHRGLVVLAVDHAEDVRELETTLPVEWIVEDSLLAAQRRAFEVVTTWGQPEDTELEVFVHGEAAFVREVRRHVRVDRGVPKHRQSVSGYWKAGSDDRQWREQKRAWAEPIDAAEAAVAG